LDSAPPRVVAAPPAGAARDAGVAALRKGDVAAPAVAGYPDRDAGVCGFKNGDTFIAPVELAELAELAETPPGGLPPNNPD